MKVLVVGGGGREHIIIKKLKENPRIKQLYALPGNAGIAELAKCVPIAANDIEGIRAFAVENAIDFAVVAPDDPLVLGCTDLLEDTGIPVFGPCRAAAVIEGSKGFSKAFMKRHNIPTAEYELFDSYDRAIEYLDSLQRYPTVIKADGLALGKGVIIAANRQEAIEALKEIMLDKKFGESGNQVVIEEYLEGAEITVLAFCDGETIIPMPSSMDHKKIYDGDNGANTGGMGVIAPNPFYTEAVARQAMEEIMLPTVRGLAAEGRSFKGCIYFGLMLTSDGIKVIEYNCRFGDPEAQAVLSLLDTDLLEIMQAVSKGELSSVDIRFKSCAACVLVLASGGYPAAYESEHEISINGAAVKATASTGETVEIYHAGTGFKNEQIVSKGGRVLNITATAARLDRAVELSYSAAEHISFKNMYFRGDIGRRALEHIRPTSGI